MYNTEIIKIWTLRVQITLSLRQDLNIRCFLGLYWKAQYDSLQTHIMHAVINDNIINNNNLTSNLLQCLLTYK